MEAMKAPLSAVISLRDGVVGPQHSPACTPGPHSQVPPAVRSHLAKKVPSLDDRLLQGRMAPW